MKILFIDFTIPYLIKDSQSPVGGFAVQLHNWLKGLVSNKSNAAVLTFKGASEYISQELDYEILDTYDQSKGIKILKYFYYYIPSLLRASRKYRPDVIIQACSGINTGIMYFISRRLNVPFIYRVASDMDVDDRCNALLMKYEQLVYRFGLEKSDAVLCQNQYQFDTLKKRFPEKHLRIIHNPYDTSRIVSRIKPRQERDYIAWVGSFKKLKNLHLLSEIAKSLPTVNFKIAGSLDHVDAIAKISVAQLQKMPNVEFVGYLKRDEVLSFLSGAIALLNTSDFEGFSNTFLEAFAAGTPVIIPCRVDPNDMVAKDNLGMVAVNDDDLVGHIENIASRSDTEYDLLAHHCQSYLCRNFEPGVKAAELIAIIKDVIIRKRQE